jgi:hypothetical protein
VPAAQDALTVAGVNLVYTPPPMTGGPVMRGLPNTVFLHEEPGYRLHDWTRVKPTYAAVIDRFDLAFSTWRRTNGLSGGEGGSGSTGSTAFFA